MRQLRSSRYVGTGREETKKNKYQIRRWRTTSHKNKTQVRFHNNNNKKQKRYQKEEIAKKSKKQEAQQWQHQAP